MCDRNNKGLGSNLGFNPHSAQTGDGINQETKVLTGRGGNSPPKNIISQSPEYMYKNFTTIILIAIVILNIFDGDFANPSILDHVKFILLAVCIVLNIIAGRRRSNV